MDQLAGFNIEEWINVAQLNGGGETQKPNIVELMSKLRTLQHGKVSLEKEIKEIKAVSDSLQKELEALHTEAYQLEATQKEKEDLCMVLKFQCEQAEQESDRQSKQNKESEELLEQYRWEIQELKLKHRKQRIKFENQLHQVIEQHKYLHSSFTPERLPDEIASVENTKSQLLSAEQVKLSQLQRLVEEIEEMKKEKQPAVVVAEALEE